MPNFEVEINSELCERIAIKQIEIHSHFAYVNVEAENEEDAERIIYQMIEDLYNDCTITNIHKVRDNE